MIRSFEFAASTMVCEPFTLLPIDAIDIQAYSFVVLPVTDVSEPFVSLLNHVVDIIIKGGLVRR